MPTLLLCLPAMLHLQASLLGPDLDWSIWRSLPSGLLCTFIVALPISSCLQNPLHMSIWRIILLVQAAGFLRVGLHMQQILQNVFWP